jgi:hypothetical protein
VGRCDEEIFNPYSAGMAVEHIQQRYGLSEDEIRRIIAADLGLRGPVSSWGYWNLAVGLGIAGVGLIGAIVSVFLFLSLRSRS